MIKYTLALTDAMTTSACSAVAGMPSGPRRRATSRALPDSHAITRPTSRMYTTARPTSGLPVSAIAPTTAAIGSA